MMKLGLGILFVSTLLIVACKPSKQEATDYQNKIIANQMFAEEQYTSFMALVSKTMQGKLNSNFSNDYFIDTAEFASLHSSLNIAITKIDSLEKFDGKTTLKTSVLNLLNTYASFYSQDFPQLVQIINFSTSNNDIEKYLRIKEKMEVQQKKAYEDFVKCNNEFTEKYMK